MAGSRRGWTWGIVRATVRPATVGQVGSGRAQEQGVPHTSRGSLFSLGDSESRLAEWLDGYLTFDRFENTPSDEMAASLTDFFANELHWTPPESQL